MDKEKRVNLGVRITPTLQTMLEKRALREKRSLSNLSEVLLEWSLQQLDRSGDTIVDLIENWEVKPVDSKKGRKAG